MTSAVHVQDLVVKYGEVLALDHVNLDVRAGHINAIIGMNGSGKSTLFKAIMGLVRPVHGLVLLEGQDPAIARRGGTVSYVPQSEEVDWTFPVSVRDVVMMGRYGRQGLSRRPSKVDEEAVDDALARVELTDLANRQIGKLSGGQRKRAFVARGIAQGARIMLLDEPFAGVDKATEATIVALLRKLADDGCAIVISTHDLHSLVDLADAAIVLRREVVFHGPVLEAISPDVLALAFGLDIPVQAVAS